VESRDDVDAAYSGALSQSAIDEAILEEFMPGQEVSVEGFVAGRKVHILTLSDKERTKPPSLLDTIVKFPSELPESIQGEICDIADWAVRALEIDDCPIHMELIVTSQGPKVVEIAARGPGFKVYTDIIPYVTGVNGVKCQIQILFRETPDLTPRMPLKGACIKFFSSEKDGVISGIHNVDDLTSHPDIYDIQLYNRPGDRVKKLTCGADRIGHIITLAKTRQRAIELAEYAFNRVEIEIL